MIRPQAGGQTKFFSSPAFEVLGGGAAGGGKSWALIILALGVEFEPEVGKPYYKVPGYRAVIFRRQSTQLSQLLDEAKRYYPRLGGKYTAQRRGDPGPCFEFDTDDPNQPSKIFFCHLENEDDKENHQGKQYQFVGFDELTQFSLTQYLYLFSRMRQTLFKGMRPRIRSTTNPTGSGLYWVKKRFITGIIPGTVGFYLADRDPKVNPKGISVPAGTLFAQSREFIPMLLEENRILTEKDPTYAMRIMQMGERMAKALLKGDWDAFGGDFFADFDYGRSVIPAFEIPKTWPLTGSLDPGHSSPCSFSLRTVDLKGNVYRVATYYERNRNADQHAEGIKTFIQSNKFTGGRWPTTIVSGLDAWAKADRFAVTSSERTFADAFESHGIFLERANTDRHNGWWAMKNLMPDRYYIFKDSNSPFLEEIMSVVADENDPEDIEGKGNDPNVIDHALDEERYGIMAADIPKQKKKLTGWQYEWMKQHQPKESEGWLVGMG